jgi:hypothetical protein
VLCFLAAVLLQSTGVGGVLEDCSNAAPFPQLLQVL